MAPSLLNTRGSDAWMRVAVVAPRAERLDGTGGAVATWITEVQAHSSWRVLGSAVSARDGWYQPHAMIKRVNALLTFIARLLSHVTSVPESRIHARLWLRDRLYVLCHWPYLRGADIVYVHNRPEYCQILRRLGYKGRLLLHMHNDPRPYFHNITNNDIQSIERFIFCSRFIRDIGVTHLGLPEKRCSVVYNGVRSHTPTPAPMSPQILFAGRLIPGKAPDSAIRLASQLRDLGVAASLTIVGGVATGTAGGDSEFAASLRRQADSLNVRWGEEVVRFVGPLGLDQVLTLMEDYPIIIVPSTEIEAFGMVLAEGISRGAVPLAPDNGGMSEILEVAGYFPVVNQEYVERALSVLMGSSLAARRRAAEDVLREFSWEQIRADYLSVLRLLG
ncbi:glycosyltransferase family 4 protein [Microbacterium sp. YY-01]|uniref:glycosyltransferase family 4 protein n=1 Tax=Microbacterium sp. YY-01 TaxID=3421634 RepID=UPI003D16E7EA